MVNIDIKLIEKHQQNNVFCFCPSTFVLVQAGLFDYNYAIVGRPTSFAML
jgi:hypothetical protein